MKTEKDTWRQELQEAGATQLLAWKGKAIFSPPPNYFTDFQLGLQNRMADETVIGHDSMLSQINKKEPFEAPEGYFDDFGNRLQGKLKQANPEQAQVKKLQPSWRPASIAAAILIFIAGSWLIFAPPLQADPFAGINEEELAAFIETEGVDAYTLAEVFDISQVEMLEASQLSEDEITDFLEENDWTEQDLEEWILEEI